MIDSVKNTDANSGVVPVIQIIMNKSCIFHLLVSICLFCNSAVQGASRVNPYGGIGEPIVKTSASFRLVKTQEYDVLVTPLGRPFVVLGINHVSDIQESGEVNWAELQQQYCLWGCTSITGTPLAGKMPYIARISLTKTSKFFNPPGGKRPYHYPDVFNPDIQHGLQQRIRKLCGQHRANPMLVGYTWTDTPCWDIVRTRALRQTDWVSEIRKLPKEAPGKQHYIDFLRKRYNNDIQQFNQSYGLSAASFSHLLVSDFFGLDRSWGAVLTDDKQFLGIIAEQFYQTIGEAQRRYDPEHLVFGEKYLAGDYPDVVLKAAAPFIDVLSIQPGDGYIDVYPPSDVFQADEFDRLHHLINKPIFICDHQISFATKEYPRTTWTQRPNEEDAATATKAFMLTAFNKPYIIGYMRCQYIDRRDIRRNALKQGLLRHDRSPYQKAIDTFRNTNIEIKKEIQQKLETPK
jgi:hypothetical protein